MTTIVIRTVSIARLILASLSALVCAGVANADLRFAIRNDTFTELVPPFDDVGFTNDLELAFWRPYRGFLIGGRWTDRLLTENYSGTFPYDRRQDLVELVGTIETTWRFLTLAGRAGSTTTGNWGGRFYQNGFHGLCQCAATLGNGLADRYIEPRRYGALVGTRVEASHTIEPATGYAVVDGQAALGTGVTSLDAALGTRVHTRIRCTELGAHAELAAMRFHVLSDGLAIPGGYGSGWQLGWRVGVHVAHGRIRVDYEYRANEGGSGEPFGMIAVTIKQAGTSY